MRGSSRARTFVVGKRTVAQSAALFQGFVSVRIGCLRITLRSIIVSINGYNFRFKDKHEAELLATSAKEGQALNRAGAQEKSIDFCQEVPASHRFGQAVIASCLKHTLSVFGRRIRSYRNNRDPLPTLLPTQMPHQWQSILILTQRNIQQDQANVALDLKHLAHLCAGSSYHDIVSRS
jgi:hypothetical protein